MTSDQFLELQERRNLRVPSLLQLYCNLVEMLRLRSEIILAASECSILQETYLKQCSLVGCAAESAEIKDPIVFTIEDENLEMHECVNYLEQGPGSSL